MIACQRDFTLTVNAGAVIPVPTAYWKLDEVSGSRIDSVNGLALSQTFGITASAAGKISLSVEFPTGASSVIQNLKSPFLSYLGTGVTVAFWCKINSINIATDSVELFGIQFYDVGGSTWNWNFNGGYSIGVGTPTGSTCFWCFCDRAFSADDSTAFDPVFPLSTGAWHFIAMWYDPLDKKPRYQIDNAAIVVGPALVSGLVAGLNGQLSIESFGSFLPYADYQIDEVGVWMSVLSAGTLTALWNGGAGKTYPF